jgi:hypothetical protein
MARDLERAVVAAVHDLYGGQLLATRRAFHDALADIVPLAHGWQPTLRIADFEVKDWIFYADAKRRTRTLLAQSL